jgi:hypothetical protein
MIRNFDSLINTDSEVIFDAHVRIWHRLYQSPGPSYLRKFLPAAVAVGRNLTEEKVEVGLSRWLLFFTRLTLSPETRLGLLADDSLDSLIEAVRVFLKPDYARTSETITVSACQFLLNLTSISLTLNQALDIGFRSMTESLKSRATERILADIVRLLDLEKASEIKNAWFSALRMARFASASLFIAAEVVAFPDFSLSMRQIRDAGLLTEDVLGLLIGLATELARIDRKFALKFIGLNGPDMLEEVKKLECERTLREFIDVLQRPEVEKQPRENVRAIQTSYASRAAICNEAKRTVASPPLPNGTEILDIPIDPPIFSAVPIVSIDDI